EGFTIREVSRILPIAGARLVFDGQASGGSFLTVGTNCEGSTTSSLTVDSYEDPAKRLSFETTPIGPDHVVRPTGSEAVGSAPSIALAMGPSQTDSPTGAAVTVSVPSDPAAPVAQAHLKRAVVSFPEGLALNPSAVAGLQSCSDAEFGMHVAIGDRISDPTG